MTQGAAPTCYAPVAGRMMTAEQILASDSGGCAGTGTGMQVPASAAAVCHAMVACGA